ncbi:hypothetical protein Tco_1493217 [Tanacetum coccineum]
MANSTTEAEYIDASNCCGHVLWLQNQLLDYGYNFMQTKIHVDNESAICVVKIPVFHSKTKHIEIRHHFIRDSYEKKLIEMVNIHTDYNVADLLTKAFDVNRFKFLVANIDKKQLAIPGQMATGKEFSNPLMAGSLPKNVGKAVVITELSVRNDLLFDDDDGITCLTNDEIYENLALMGAITTDASLVAAQGSDNILKTQSTAMSNDSLSQEIGSGDRPRRQDTTLRGADAQTRPETASKMSRDPPLSKPNEPPLSEGHTSGSGEGRMKHTFELMDIIPPTPYDSPLSGGYIPGSDEGRLKLEELMAMCTKLSKQVLDLEKEKDAQSNSDFNRLDDDMENVEGETVYAATTGVSTAKELVSTARPTVNTARPEVSAASVPMSVSVATPVTPPTTTTVFDDDEDLTIAQTLVKMRSEKAKEKGVAFRDVEEIPRLTTTRSTTTLQPLPTIDPKDKGKGVLVEEEPKKPEKVKRRDQGQKQEKATNAALAEEFDEIQAIIDTDHELVVRLTHEEQEKYTIEERARLLAEFFKRRKKQLAAERAEEIRNKPPTRTQEEKKSVEPESEGKKGKRIKRVVDSTLKQKSSKKQKSDEEAAADYEQEKEELRMWLTVVPDEEEIVDPEILSAKYPIVDWESQSLGSDIHVYKIIRADGNTSYHKTFSSMLRKFDRQDLMGLHRLVMKKFEDNAPEGYNLLVWGDLKIMFEPNAEDEVWSNQQDWTLISWKLYKNCGVHSLLMDGTLTCFNMLVEKRYPLVKEMLEKILNWKLEAEAGSTMAFELLKFIKSQLED